MRCSPPWRGLPQAAADEPPGHARHAAALAPAAGPLAVDLSLPRRQAAGRCGPRRALNLWPPDNDDITTAAVTDLIMATTRRRKILGGLINEY